MKRVESILVLVATTVLGACGGVVDDSNDGGKHVDQGPTPCGSKTCLAPQWCVYPPGPDYYVEGGAGAAPECVTLDPKCDPTAAVSPHQLMLTCCTQPNTTLACVATVGDAGARVLTCSHGAC